MVDLEEFIRRMKAEVFLEFMEKAINDKKTMTFLRSLIKNGCPIEALEEAFYDCGQVTEEDKNIE